MKTVNFTEMKNGSKEDYELLEKFEKNFERQTACLLYTSPSPRDRG